MDDDYIMRGTQGESVRTQSQRRLFFDDDEFLHRACSVGIMMEEEESESFHNDMTEASVGQKCAGPCEYMQFEPICAMPNGPSGPSGSNDVVGKRGANASMLETGPRTPSGPSLGVKLSKSMVPVPSEEYGTWARSTMCNIFQTSIENVQKRSLVLDNDSVWIIRASCIRRMKQILDYCICRYAGIVGSDVEVLSEVNVTNAVLILEWIVDNESVYLVENGCDLVCCMCILQSVERSEIVSSGTFQITGHGSDSDSRAQGIGISNGEMKSRLYDTLLSFLHATKSEYNYTRETLQEATHVLAQKMQHRYTHMDFLFFAEYYHAEEPIIINRMMHFLFLHLTCEQAHIGSSLFDNFVEIAIRETADIQTCNDIFFDYCLLLANSQATSSKKI